MNKTKSVAQSIANILKSSYFDTWPHPPKIWKLICRSHGTLYTCKNQSNSSTYCWDIEIFLIQHNLGMSGHAWPRPPKTWQLIYSSHGTLPACKKSHTCEAVGHNQPIGPVLPFYPICNPKNQNFREMKTMPGDIIVFHHCTKNHNHSICSSSDKVWTSFLLILGHFCPFYLICGQKNQNFRIWKKTWR